MRAAMIMMMTLFLTLTMMTGSGLGYSCLRNEDCVSACCSGYGWCVGPQSGDMSDILRAIYLIFLCVCPSSMGNAYHT